MDANYIRDVERIKALLNSQHGDVQGANKDEFHRIGLRVLRKLAKMVSPYEFVVRSNKGGPAVGGEVILHTPKVYIMLSGSGIHALPIMFRSCKGMRDYTGGVNQWVFLPALIDEAWIDRQRQANLVTA